MHSALHDACLPKLDDIVLLRGIACIFVMMVHITSDATVNLRVASASSIIFSFINIASTYVVPAFVFISGFTLYYIYKDSNLNIPTFYYKRFKSTLTPYLIWTIIYYGLFVKLFGYPVSIKFLASNLLLGSMVYHLYFVVIVCQFYIVFPLILYLYKRFNILLITFIMVILNLLSHKFLIFPYSDRFFLNYILFFGLGCTFATYKNNIDSFIKKHNLFVILLNIWVTIFYCAEIYLARNYAIYINPIGYTWHLFCMTSIIFYYYLSTMIIEKSEKYDGILTLLKSISINSYIIYLSHPIVLMILDYLFKDLNSIVLKTILKGLFVLTFFSLYSLHKDNLFNCLKYVNKNKHTDTIN